MNKKGPKVLDPENVCKCGTSGSSKDRICPLNDVMPPFDLPPTKCNCCNKCYSKCSLEV